MKKALLFLFIFINITCQAYEIIDVSSAVYLSNKGIIVKQSTAEKYRINDTITRAEAVGMALKIRGIILPTNYQCKKYFIDVIVNDWVCRAMENAAHQGIISQLNNKARPADTITRSEALAIILKAVPDVDFTPGSSYNIFTDETLEWQKNMYELVMKNMLSSGIPGTQEKYDKLSGRTYINYFPNRAASRGEFFWFAKQIMEGVNAKKYHVKIIDNPPQENIYTHEVTEGGPSILYFGAGDTKIELDRGNIYHLNTYDGLFVYSKVENEKKIVNVINMDTGEKLGKIVDGIGSSDGAHIYSCYPDIDDNNKLVVQIFSLAKKRMIFDSRSSEKFWNIAGCKYLYDSTHNTLTIDTFGDRTINTFIFSFLTGFFSDGNFLRVLNQYYATISVAVNNKDMGLLLQAYEMRSGGVSFETFQSWYKNVTKVVFREDTLQDLGNNTYEFLVEMTENGIKSTYKVKSKVDLENFKINNISSVKQ